MTFWGGWFLYFISIRHPELVSGSIISILEIHPPLYKNFIRNSSLALNNSFKNSSSLKKGYTYMMSNYNRTILYVGMTNDIEVRVLQHKAGVGSNFTTKYNLKFLMYFEEYPSIKEAIKREKQLKNWRKKWKWNLIKENNKSCLDLAADWFDEQDILAVKTGRF